MQQCYTILVLVICVGAITVLSVFGQEIESKNFHLRTIVDDLNQTVEDIRPNITNPLDIEATLPISLSVAPLLDANLTLINPSIYGINGILIPYLFLQMVGTVISFVFTIPTLEIRNILTTDMNILGVFPIHGNDTASMTVNHLEIKGHAAATLIPLSLKNLSLEINLESIGLELHGLQDSEDFSSFASSLMTLLGNQLIVTYLNDNSVAVGEAISPTIEEIINGILNGTSTETPQAIQGLVTEFATRLTEKLYDEVPEDYEF